MRFLRYLVLGLALMAGAASAQSYPDKSKTLRIILPQGPGSASDVVTRALGRAITDVSGLSVIVDYKPGAETVIGVQALMNAPPDGYNMLLTSSSTHVLNPLMMPNLPYDPLRDFIPLAGISKVLLAMNLGPSTPFKTAREFIAAAKANPGKYSYGSATATSRLAGELLQANAGIKLLNVPYKSVGAGMTAVAAGEVDLMFADSSSSAPHWQGGRVRAVAIGSTSRLPTLPNVPTVMEEGVPDFESYGWFITFFARGTPPEIAAAMREILRKALKTPLMAETFAQFSMEPLDVVGDDLTTLSRREVDRWTKLIRSANLKLQ